MRSTRHAGRQAGFTLIEMVIVIVLLGILAASGATMLADAMKAARFAALNHSSGSQARYALERIGREIREMDYGTLGYQITTLNSSTSLSFTKNDGTLVAVTQAAPVLNLWYSGTSSVLTNQLSSMSVAYYDIDGNTTIEENEVRWIQITLNVVNTVTGTADSQRTRIFLRNAV